MAKRDVFPNTPLVMDYWWENGHTLHLSRDVEIQCLLFVDFSTSCFIQKEAKQGKEEGKMGSPPRSLLEDWSGSLLEEDWGSVWNLRPLPLSLPSVVDRLFSHQFLRSLPPPPPTPSSALQPHRLSTLGKLSKVVCWAAQSGKSPYQGPVCFPTPRCSCSLQWEENHLAIFGSLDCPHQSSSRQHHTCCWLTPKMTCQSIKSMPVSHWFW